MLIMHMAFLMRWYVSRCHSQEILLFARKETSLLAGMVQQRDEAFFVQTLSVFMMSWNLSWAHSHPKEVIDGFCRVVVRNCDSRLVTS